MFAACFDHHAFWWNRFAKLILAVFWCSGMILGLCGADAAGITLLSLMDRIRFSLVSIVGILLPDLFFLFATALAVLFAKPWLCLPVVFIRSFCLSFFLQGMVLAWQRQVWLPLLLYGSELLACGALLWFCLRYITKIKPAVWRDWCVTLLVHLLAALSQYYMALHL